MTAQLLFGAGDSVTFGTTGSASANSASFNSSALSNMQVGDLLVAWIHDQTSTAGTITPPSGWVHYGAPLGVPSMSTSRTTGFYYYPIKAATDITGLPASPTWTFSSGARVACVVARATGIDLDNIEDSASASFSGGGAGSSLTITGITTTNATTLLVGGLFHENSISTTSPNTTSFMTAFQEYRTNPDATVANTGAAMGYQYLTSAGATGNIGATYDSSATITSGELVAFKAGPWSPPPGSSNPAIVGSPTTFTNQNAATTFTISTPAGLQDGDVLILALSAQTPTATSDFSSSGRSRVSQAFIASSSTYRLTAFYALPVPTAASAASSYTFTNTDSASGGRVCAAMFIVRNADLSNLVVASSPYGAFSSPSVTVQPSRLSYDNSLLLVTYNAQFTSAIDYTIASGPTGMTQVSSLITSTGAVSKTALALYQQNVNSGTLSADVNTWNGAPAQATGVGIVIKALGQAAANPGVPIKYTSAPDTLTDGKLFYTSATDTLSTPLEVRPFPTGYASVAAMLATNPFYVAHRGGDLDWPEMSLHAYTQSGFWGVGALEISLARTSDGVWFGLHDSSLDRTTLGTGGGSGTTLVASSMTWAQVQQNQINYPSVNNPSSLPQPYMRWEELMAAYYGTHVIFVDPKVAQAFTAELLNMMDAMPNSPTTQFVAKSYGVTGNAGNTTGFPHDAAARGYKTWGYFYEADYSNVPTYQGRFDILGMDYTATASSWTQIMSYGKPVIGHIAPNAAAVTTALGFGATGVMVSGVQEAISRSP